MEPVSLLDREDFMRMAERHFRELNPAFEPHADWKQSYFENILRNQRLFLRWITAEGKRAGFILFGIEDHRFLPRQTGAIYELYVDPAFRRSGIARASATAAIRELQTHAPSKVQLEIVKGNQAAERLWKSLGFQKASERWVLKAT
jgi:ribosomal protein S18 acetylase RimI-like enzyme